MSLDDTISIDNKKNPDKLMNQINWNEIGISDDFMFGKVMRKPELCKRLFIDDTGD